jgi:hypothetical protein
MEWESQVSRGSVKIIQNSLFDELDAQLSNGASIISNGQVFVKIKASSETLMNPYSIAIVLGKTGESLM